MFEIFKPNNRYLQTPESLVIKKKLKEYIKLTVEMWSQKLDKMASFGLGNHQRMLEILGL